MSKPKRVKIYKSRWHLLFTGLVVGAPLVFLFVFSRIIHVAASDLFMDVLVSSGRLLAAYLIAVVLAWVCAVSFYRGKRADVALPVFDVLQSFPTTAALPIATFFWGASNGTVIFFLAITVIWPIIFSMISSLKLIKHDWEEAAEIMNLKGWDYIKYFIWPASIPGLITGSIIGLGEGWESLVATEIILSIKSGLGDFFQIYAHNPTVTVFGILGFLLFIFSLGKVIWLPLLEWSHKTMEE